MPKDNYRWRKARIAEGLCGDCGKLPLAVDTRRHMAARGALITRCRPCADKMRAAVARRR